MKKILAFFKKKWVIGVLIGIASIALLAAGFLLYIYPFDKMAVGVIVDGVNIGRMTQYEAKIAISQGESLDDEKIVFTDKTGATAEILGSDIMLSRNIDKTIEDAYKIGRSGDYWADFAELAKQAFVPYDIGYVYSIDKDKLNEAIYSFGVSVNGELQEYTVEEDGGYIKVSRGIAGQSKDVSAVLSAAEEAITNGVFNIEVAMEKSDPPAVNEKTLMEFVAVPAVDAVYEVVDGQVKITDEIPGRSLNPEEVANKIDALLAGETITLKSEKVMPTVTKTEIYRQLFKHTMGEFSSKYNASKKARSSNVILATKMIDGIILAPGEIFSYNKALGPRTVQRGFKEAPVYSNGESVMGIGGGICQVSSTLYSAVLYADLEIVERRNHSMTVDYMPNGQDATVSYGSIDFKFKNNTDSPVRIAASAGGGTVKVSISGTEPQNEKTVKIVNSTVSVKNKTVEEVQDSTLSPGVRKTETVGKTGYVVDTYRKIYENGKETKSEYIGRSSYRMVPQKVRVGVASVDIPVSGEGTVPEESPAPDGDGGQEATPTPEAGNPSVEPTVEPSPAPTATPSTVAPTEEPSDGNNRPEMNTEPTEE